MVTTGLSGNEIYCLNQKGYAPGNIVVGNAVYSLGTLRKFATGMQSMFGGELPQVTEVIQDGRESAYNRLVEEAKKFGASGVTGITSEIIYHAGNIEFLSMGSAVHHNENKHHFTSSAGGQDLFLQLDAGAKPITFAFGNVAYSLGLRGGIMSSFKQLKRGEIKELSGIFNNTRHLALQRIIKHAKANNANAVLGIETNIISNFGLTEMLMIGTASDAPQFAKIANGDVVTSGLSNLEFWNMVNLGYAPVQLLLGTSVFSLGFVGGVTSTLKSFVRGEINELTTLIYEAREHALGLINDQAKAVGADDVVGVKTYVYQLGNGLIEFLAIGTAVKKVTGLKTESKQLPVQVTAVEQDTFYDSEVFGDASANLNRSVGTATNMPMNVNRRLFLIPMLIFLVLLVSIFAQHGSWG